MIQRMFLVILLLSSHALALRSAVGAITTHDASVMAEPCCPLCVPASDTGESQGCGCGCGQVEQDNRIPTSPKDTPGVLSVERWVPDAEPTEIRVIEITESQRVAISDGFVDAPGHTETNRFLARIGVWLN